MFENLHILIAEDDPDDGEILCESFAKHPNISKVDWVKNGKALIEFLKNNPGKNPDAILTDINMPILNGMEALEIIFNDTRLSSIPVFVYSSTINPVYEAKSKSLGAFGYLIKPFSLIDFDDIPNQLIRTLEAHQS